MGSGSRWRQGHGFTTIELMVAVAILGLFVGAFYSAWDGFFKDVSFQEKLARAERETRPVIRSLVIELRQALPASEAANATAVTALSWNGITFTTDRDGDGAPERYQYALTSCGGEGCSLTRTITTPVAGSGPNYTYTGTGTTITVLRNVVADATGRPLFSAKSVSAAGAFSSVTSCNGTSVACSFPLVVIDLRLDVSGAADTPRLFEVQEQVRFRNA